MQTILLCLDFGRTMIVRQVLDKAKSVGMECQFRRKEDGSDHDKTGIDKSTLDGKKAKSVGMSAN